MDISEVNSAKHFHAELNDWWANARYRELTKAISFKEKTSLVDIGCGSGQNLFFIQRDYPHVRLMGFDNKSDQVSYDWLPDEIAIFSRIQPEMFDADVYLLMDVLEHIDEPGNFLSEIVKKARRGSTFFISVPAFPLLWSQRDTLLGHYRRYTKHSTLNLCIKAGLTVEKCRFKFSFLFFPLLLLRKTTRSIGLKRQTGSLATMTNILLDLLSRIEEKLPRLPFGTSIILVGRKN